MNLSTPARAQIHVPRNAFANDVPLVAVLRGEFVGSLHRGSLAVCDSAGSVSLVLGDPAQQVFLRSAAKPFQVMPAVLSGGIERYGISDRELAVLCASHSGELRHQEAVLAVLDRIGLDEGALQCGVHPPLNEQAAAERMRSGVGPTPVCNNCSGAHAGMLVACRARGWPIDGYGSPDHPLQIETRQILGAFAGIEGDTIHFAVDNCAVPTFLLPLDRAAMAFARLATGGSLPPELREAAGRVVEAMTAHPQMVGGQGRFDTDLMRAGGRTIVAKGGAEAFQGVGMTDLNLGMALKISDGNARAVPPATVRVLDHLGAIAESHDELAEYRSPLQESMRGEPVGRLTPVFAFGGAR